MKRALDKFCTGFLWGMGFAYGLRLVAWVLS